MFLPRFTQKCIRSRNVTIRISAGQLAAPSNGLTVSNGGGHHFNETIHNWFSSTSGSDSITYSGGQASVGQGGFYGSGGARALSPDHASTTTDNVFDQQNKERNKMLAVAQDVQTVRLTMQELDLLESLLRNEEETIASKSSSSDGVSSKSMEIKKFNQETHDFHGLSREFKQLGSPR